jgi:hypothetical protein
MCMAKLKCVISGSESHGVRARAIRKPYVGISNGKWKYSFFYGIFSSYFFEEMKKFVEPDNATMLPI